ncbi:MAG: XdhC/CoxI family protein [Acidobacteria bacterium]|nr:MAG: XdhC/CoxI family protein [Acidobacteriota bacterium]GIK76381.1 MAG: xanthine dehydrogenase accessory factor [Actinomycetes bacterium]
MTTVATAAEVACDRLAEGRRVVAATLVERIGSAPFDPGAEMMIDDAGRVEGTVTGGCVESALAAEAEDVLAGGAPRLVRYGVSDEQAFEVGLMCGGTVSVFVHELRREHLPALRAATAARAAGEPVALATLMSGERAGAKLAVTRAGAVGSLGTGLLDHNVEREARGLVDEGISRIRAYGSGGEVMGGEIEVYVQAFETAPAMVVYGAIDYSVALARLAAEVGYRVTICDARPAFAEGRRFADVAEVVVDWPDRDLARRELGPRDAVLVFTHDPKFDEPALIAALRSGAGYVGALGSRRTQAMRIERLRAAGVRDDALGRLHAPCGLDLGARTPEETAVSILAEIVASRTGRGGEPLARTDGPIHPGGP